MQYIIKAKEPITEVKEKCYVIKAKSYNEAKRIAENDLPNEINGINVEKLENRTFRIIAAFGFMIVSLVLGWWEWSYVKTTGFLFWKKSSTISIDYLRPDAKSVLLSIILYVVFILKSKGIKEAVESWVDILMMILVLLNISSLIHFILSISDIDLHFFKIKGVYVIFVILAVSILGMKTVSAASFVIVGIVSLAGVDKLNEAMGYWAIVYFMSVFIGFLLYLSTEPSVIEITSNIGRVASSGGHYIYRQISVKRE